MYYAAGPVVCDIELRLRLRFITGKDRSMGEKDERGSGAFEGGDGVFEESRVEKYKVARLVVEFESSILSTDHELASGVAANVGHCDKALGIVRAVSVREDAEVVHDGET